MTKQVYLKTVKSLMLARDEGKELSLPDYLSEQMVAAFNSMVFTQDELMSAINAHCYSINGTLLNDEILPFFEQMKKAVIL